MQKIIFLALVLFILKSGRSQTQKYYDYIEASMATEKARLNADSVNLKFKTTLHNIAGIALAQAPANYIQLQNDQVKEALEDIKANIAFEDFIKKYNCKKTEKDLRVTRCKYKNRENQDVTEFVAANANESCGHHMIFFNDALISAVSLKTPWLFEYHEKTDLFNEVLQAFYFTDDFLSVQIPVAYTNMIRQSASFADTLNGSIREKYTQINMKMEEAKQVESSWLVLSTKLADQAVRRKRRELILNSVLNWLPLLLLSIK